MHDNEIEQLMNAGRSKKVASPTMAYFVRQIAQSDAEIEKLKRRIEVVESYRAQCVRDLAMATLHNEKK